MDLPHQPSLLAIRQQRAVVCTWLLMTVCVCKAIYCRFHFSHARSMTRMVMAVCLFTTFGQTEVTQQLLDGLHFPDAKRMNNPNDLWCHQKVKAFTGLWNIRPDNLPQSRTHTFSTDIHFSQTMCPHDFGDSKGYRGKIGDSWVIKLCNIWRSKQYSPK